MIENNEHVIEGTEKIHLCDKCKHAWIYKYIYGGHIKTYGRCTMSKDLFTVSGENVSNIIECSMYVCRGEMNVN